MIHRVSVENLYGFDLLMAQCSTPHTKIYKITTSLYNSKLKYKILIIILVMKLKFMT